MPAKSSRSANNPVSLAEAILDALDKVPGARACFIQHIPSSETLKLQTALINAPEVDRWHSTRGYHWIGTYAKGATQSQVVEDVRETMSRIR